MSDPARLKAALRLVLWNQGRSHAQVARLWGCSEAQVQSQLNQAELPLSRLMALLDWLNMSLTDLQMLADSNRTLEILQPTRNLNGYFQSPAIDITPRYEEPSLRPLLPPPDDGRILLRKSGKFNLMREPEPGFLRKVLSLFGRILRRSSS
jgi:hypothetical protein